jgi:ribulose-phosphate 3-epimerase
VQIDIIDGRFADNITVSPSDVPQIEFGELQCDFHLMTEEPMDFVFEMIEHKALLPIRAVIAQVERMSSQHFFLEEVEKNEWIPGVSLDIFTPLDAIDQESWRYIKILQLMAVEAGEQGQEFNSLVMKKLAELKKFIEENELEVEIIIDGSMNEKTVPLVATAGADSIAVGSALWDATDKEALLKSLYSV